MRFDEITGQNLHPYLAWNANTYIIIIRATTDFVNTFELQD